MVFFIGIKGTGMAALACILNDLGMEVSRLGFDEAFLHRGSVDRAAYPDPAV